MVIVLENEVQKLRVPLVDENQFNKTYGYWNTWEYPYKVDKYGVFVLLDHDGLMGGGHQPTNITTRGINQDGQLFSSNSWSANVFTLTFKHTYGLLYQKLNQLKMYKNYPLKVTVNEFGKTYTMYCIIDSQDLESGVITFSSALPDKGTYWSLGMRDVIFRASDGAFVQDRWATDLRSYNWVEGGTQYYGRKHSIFVTGEQTCQISFKDYGGDFRLIHDNTGKEYVVTNADPTKEYMWDSATFKHTIGGDEDVNYAGDFIILVGGEDTFTLVLSNCTQEEFEAFEWRLTYEQLALGIMDI